jgi:hypothetical protein
VHFSSEMKLQIRRTIGIANTNRRSSPDVLANLALSLSADASHSTSKYVQHYSRPLVLTPAEVREINSAVSKRECTVGRMNEEQMKVVDQTA